MPQALTLIGLVVCGGAALVSPSSARSQSSGALRTQLEGRWELVGTLEQAQATIDRAIERSVATMDFFAQPIARHMLHDGVVPESWIQLHFEREDQLAVRFSTGDSHTTTLGSTERRTSHGSEVRVTQRLRAAGELEQVFETDEGTRWYVYGPRGLDVLRVTVTTGSPRMPAPVVFVLDYQRH